MLPAPRLQPGTHHPARQKHNQKPCPEIGSRDRRTPRVLAEAHRQDQLPFLQFPEFPSREGPMLTLLTSNKSQKLDLTLPKIMPKSAGPGDSIGQSFDGGPKLFEIPHR